MRHQFPWYVSSFLSWASFMLIFILSGLIYAVIQPWKNDGWAIVPFLAFGVPIIFLVSSFVPLIVSSDRKFFQLLASIFLAWVLIIASGSLLYLAAPIFLP